MKNNTDYLDAIKKLFPRKKNQVRNTLRINDIEDIKYLHYLLRGDIMKLKKSLLMLLSYIFLICCVFLTSCQQTSNTIDLELIDYKEIMISEIISYKDSKIENNFYSESGFKDLNSICETSISEIYKAEEKVTIDLICSEAKIAMDLVNSIEPLGHFFSLQVAYENNKLTSKDIKSIATANLGLEQLDFTVEYVIKKQYLELSKNEQKPNLEMESISIIKYYGEYNGCYVLQIIDAYSDFPAVEQTYTIDGVVINFSGPEILVWESENF